MEGVALLQFHRGGVSARRLPLADGSGRLQAGDRDLRGDRDRRRLPGRFHAAAAVAIHLLHSHHRCASFKLERVLNIIEFAISTKGFCLKCIRGLTLCMWCTLETDIQQRIGRKFPLNFSEHGRMTIVKCMQLDCAMLYAR